MSFENSTLKSIQKLINERDFDYVRSTFIMRFSYFYRKTGQLYLYK